MRKAALPWHGWTWDTTGKHGSQWFCALSESVRSARLQGIVEVFRSVIPVSFLWIKRLTVCEWIAAWLYFTNDKLARRPVSRVLSACFHGGRPFLWDAPRGTPLATNPNGEAGMPPLLPPEGGAAAVPIRSCSRWGLPCHPCCQGRGALLPHRFALARGSRTLARAVCFLWHCPWGRPRRPLAGTVFPWSPDFPLRPRAFPLGNVPWTQRPSSRLASAGHERRRATRQAIYVTSAPAMSARAGDLHAPAQ
jgi:hypothetical protein